MRTINMLSSAEMVKGQGVSSAYLEQVSLVSQGLDDRYRILVNSRKRCDILHFHTIDPTFYMTASIHKHQSAAVGYVHFLPDTIDESLRIPKLGRKVFYKYIVEFYDSMDYLVTVNPSFIPQLESYGIDGTKVTYIPNYVSDQQFYPYDAEQVAEVKQRWEIPADRFIVLGVGQVQTRKGVFDFVETAQNLPDALFIWVGGFSFGPMTEGYKELKELMTNAPPNVMFTGIVDRSYMNDLYNVSDVMFLPSFNELFPMTVLESMCCKKPILLRDLDLYKNILFDYYLKGNRVADFVDILQNLMNNQELYNECQEKSYAGHNYYGKESVLKMWQDFYDRVYDDLTYYRQQHTRKRFTYKFKKVKRNQEEAE